MLLYSYFEKGCRKKCVRDNPERLYGIWLNKIWYDRTYISCFPLALANICPWPLVPFIQIALKNSAVKTTHNTFLDCRVHFFRQPFSKLAVYATFTFPIMHLIWSPRPHTPKFCTSIVFNSSWDGCITQEKWKTKVMQNLGGGGQIRYIMGNVEVA